MKKYLAISAGDGNFTSKLHPSLEWAIKWLRLDFEDYTGAEVKDPFVEKLVRDPDEWDGHGVGSGRMKFDGEQCYFEIIEVTS